jgi:putative cell wall-binding protein
MDPDGSSGGYYRSITGNLGLRTEDVTGVPYIDTGLHPDAFVVPGAAAVAVDGAPIWWDQAMTNQRGTLALDRRLRVEEQVGGDGVTPLTLRVRALDNSTSGWVAADQLVPRDSAGPELWAMNGVTVLSPNGDGEHDVINLSAQLSEAASWRLRIRNGSGSTLVETTGTGNVATISWDGVVSGAVVPDGLYEWTLRAEDGWGNPVLSTQGSFFVRKKPELRYAGADRYATAAAISAANFPTPGIPVVYVATGVNFPDALAGAAVAGSLGGPLLLVTRDTIPGATQTELARLQPDKIVILGAAGVVSDAVAEALRPYTNTAVVERYAGADRYATAAAISGAHYPTPGVAVAYVATGLNFPDALAGAAVAGNVGGPLLLVTRDSIPSATAAELARLQPDKIVILGAAGVVSDAVAEALRPYTNTGTVERFAGADRYSTAAAISAANFAPGVDVAYVATGTNFPDALAGAAVAGNLGGPLLLVTRDSIPGATATELDRLDPNRIVILGSTGVVGPVVAAMLAGYETD